MNCELENKLNKLIFLITSKDSSRSNFGTGFLIKQEGDYSYILTCAHVIEDVGGAESVKVKNSLSVEIVVNGSTKGVDLAVLKVTGLEKYPLLPLSTSAKKGQLFILRGFSGFLKEQKVARTVEGIIGDKIRIEPSDIIAWDLSIKPADDFSKLLPGNSGSPVLDDNGSIFAVLSHRKGENKGHAISTANLKKIWPDMSDDLLSTSRVEKPFGLFAYDEYWVGREKIVGELSTLLRGSQTRLLLILGLTGIGKTALAEKLALDLNDWVENDWKNKFCRANFDYSEKPTDFLTTAIHWLEAWGEKLTTEEAKPERLLGRLVKHLCDNRVLVLIDSMERLLTGNESDGWGDFSDEWWKRFFLHVLSAEHCKSLIIVTSQDLPTMLDDSRYNTFISRSILYGLDENELKILFRKTGFDISEYSPEQSILFRLGKAYKGHPLVLRVILGEIIEDFQRDVQNYWENERNNVVSVIEEVEKAIKEATEQGKIEGIEDEWMLHKLTRKVRKRVNEERLQMTFSRLKKDVNDAYILICAASVYRIPVQEEGWLMQLDALITRLERQVCSQERQHRALEELYNRFLVEKSVNHNNKHMVGQHNLVRSIALEHNKWLIQSLKRRS